MSPRSCFSHIVLEYTNKVAQHLLFWESKCKDFFFWNLLVVNRSQFGVTCSSQITNLRKGHNDVRSINEKTGLTTQFLSPHIKMYMIRAKIHTNMNVTTNLPPHSLISLSNEATHRQITPKSLRKLIRNVIKTYQYHR